MNKSLIEKDDEIKRLKEQQRNMIGDAVQRTVIEKMVIEIASLKEQNQILQQRVEVQEMNEEHGYF